ncbi:uncharacterized protein LOC120627859 [Pararge aegeria]|nr:uncharacterized protein LOC120627859 [Pararge aegeria]XP_039751900.1 uncharacterized protein LOC120627859 [Pararge aegeria]XP_039751901.1 uncharacterized protein LOC120627859 [Pararge aegeria]XP_039751902.1 uncharacterized protein LOC120627859 [Pararge aegeria]
MAEAGDLQEENDVVSDPGISPPQQRRMVYRHVFGDDRMIPPLYSLTASADEFEPYSKEIEFNKNSVCGINECLTTDAKRLCIFDLSLKLTRADHYDIGGTYYHDLKQIKPELWFYYTTSVCPQSNFLLNLFFSFRKGGFASIGISESNTITKQKHSGEAKLQNLTLSENLFWKAFKSNEKQESHHLKTYCFTKQDLKVLVKQTFCIPIRIKISNNMSVVDADVLLRIKRSHNLSSLFKRQEDTDFILESMSGTKYQVHKILLAAVSSALRGKLKESNGVSLFLDIDDCAMEQFLEYIYTGTVTNIVQDNWCQLIELANQFNLNKLFEEVEIAIIQQISIDNAIAIALMSEKYKLDKIQKRILDFIRSEPKVLDSEGWNNLNDVQLTKKWLKELYREDVPD